MPLSPYLKNLRAKVGTDLMIFPSVCGLVFNDSGEILLQRRSDNARWSTIAGMLEPGELPADGVIREVFEETGLHVIPERITGVYLTPAYTYPDGNRAQFVTTAFLCRPTAGTPHAHDDESLEVRYFSLDALPELSEDHRQRIIHAHAGGATWFAPPQSIVTA